MAALTENQRKRFSAALTRLDGDEETLLLLAGMVAEDAPMLLDQLKSNIQSSDSACVAATGHALKGLLSTFETGSPVSELQPLIDAARADDGDTVYSLFTVVAPALEKLVGEVRDLTGKP